MTTSIVFSPYPSGPTVTMNPDLVVEFTTRRASRNVLHEVIGSPDLYVTLREGGRRSGSWVMLFELEADAQECFDTHMLQGTFAIADTDRPAVACTYVTDGEAELQLDDETRSVWLVTVPYREAAL